MRNCQEFQNVQEQVSYEGIQCLKTTFLVFFSRTDKSINLMSYIFPTPRYQLQQPGTYTVQVQACSLAHCGEWSNEISVSVSQKSTAYLLYVILIPVLVVVLVITLLASGFIYVKYKASNTPEITPNPWYHNIVSRCAMQ